MLHMSGTLGIDVIDVIFLRFQESTEASQIFLTISDKHQIHLN